MPPPPHHHILKKPTSLIPDFIFSAVSFFLLFTTSRKPPKMSNSISTPPFATPQSLSDWLKPRLSSDLFSSWGVKPGTKNVHNLWLELAEGETHLADSTPPIRTVEVLILRITRNDGKLLVESHQELSDGTVRRRFRPLSEKMKPGESVEAAVFRAVREELGRGEGVRIREGSYGKKVEERASESYPGLPACYVLHTVEAEVEGLPDGEFDTEEDEEYAESEQRDVAGCAVKCRKHFWKWVENDGLV